MAFALPPAPRRYDRKNENQARRAVENAFEDIFSRLTKLEADVAAGVTPTPDPVGPTAGFSWDADDLAVTFTDTSTAGDEAISAWAWDFGDGNTSDQQNPSHTYSAAGDYTVVLTVTDDGGLSDDSDSTTVTVTAPPGTTFVLPVGFAGMDTHMRKGPGNSTTDIYNLYHYNPHQRGLNNLVADIEWARANGVKLILNTAGGPSGYGASSAAGFSMSDYTAELDELKAAGGQTLTDAFADKVCLAYIIDEPNHPKWDNSSGQNTVSPTTVNQIGREHKNRWPGCLTFARVLPEHLVNGWDQHDPIGDYDAIDYTWIGYSGQHTRVGTLPHVLYDEQTVFADAINVGLAFTQNIWDGGLDDDLDGVSACWDTKGDGSNIGAIVGTNSNNFDKGEHISCATLNSQSPPALKNLCASPDWIKQVADRMYNIAGLPFITYWTYPELSSLTPWAETLYLRDDYVAAIEYAQQKFASRTNPVTLRTAKP